MKKRIWDVKIVDFKVEFFKTWRFSRTFKKQNFEFTPIIRNQNYFSFFLEGSRRSQRDKWKRIIKGVYNCGFQRWVFLTLRSSETLNIETLHSNKSYTKKIVFFFFFGGLKKIIEKKTRGVRVVGWLKRWVLFLHLLEFLEGLKQE